MADKLNVIHSEGGSSDAAQVIITVATYY